jgi:hypothetical protein
LGGDWEILFDDETVGTNAVAGLKMIRKAVASPTVISANTLYSAVTVAMSELNFMDDEFPMLPVTPTAYTMENEYFMPRSSTEFLNGGAIESVSWTTEIRSITYTDTVADFVAGDVGRQVTGGITTDTGTLLDFEVLPDGTKLAWIRPDDPATDTFANASETLTVTGDGGTGDCTSTAISTTGESLYANVQAIGSVPTASETYLIQDRVKMTSSTGGFQWWATDPTLSLGIIDILVRVKRDDVLVADGDVELFSRRYTSLFDNFRLNVSAGGRSAIPLASSPDINNTTGYRRVTEVGATGTGTFLVGEVATEAVSGASVVITAVGGSSATPVLQYYLVGDLTDLFGSGAQTLTGADSSATMTTAAPVANLLGPTDTASGEGGTVTVNFGDFNTDHDGDGTAEPYSIQIDAQSNVPAKKVYERIKYLCRRGAGDPFNTPIGIDGEQWRGLSLQFSYDATGGGGIAEGETIETITGGSTWTGHCVRNNATAGITYITATDDQTSVDALVDNDVVREIGFPGDTNTVDTGTGGGYAIRAFTSPKSSPFGTFTGTQIFGARGVDYINPNSGESQTYSQTGDDGTLRTPPNTVSVTVTGLDGTGTPLNTDRVFVARDTGVAGIIDKDQNGGMTVQAISALTVVVGDPSIDPETPQSGVLRVVDADNQDEQRYHYSSWATSTFTLTVVTDATGTGTAGGGLTTIIGSATAWSTGGTPVVPGMLVRNTTQGTVFSEVVEVVSDTELTVTDNGTSWASQAFEINQTVRAYDTVDNMFVPIIDEYATATSATNSLVKTPASDFGIVVNVRQGKVILPFTQNNTVGDNGRDIPANRILDTIAT